MQTIARPACTRVYFINSIRVTWPYDCAATGNVSDVNAFGRYEICHGDERSCFIWESPLRDRFIIEIPRVPYYVFYLVREYRNFENSTERK